MKSEQKMMFSISKQRKRKKESSGIQSNELELKKVALM
jgi:hypothetical protein